MNNQPQFIKDVIKNIRFPQAETVSPQSIETGKPTKEKTTLKVKLPNDTYEVVRESFAITTGRLKDTQLETITTDEMKKIYNEVTQKTNPSQLQFPFTETQDLYLYKRKSNAGEMSYYIPKEILENEKPSFPLMKRSYLASLVMAFEQKSPIIQFTLKDKLKKLGYTDEAIRKGGKIFKQLDVSEKALAGIHFHYKNNKRGRQKIEIIGSYYSILKTGEGKGAKYEAFINPVFTSKIDFADGKITDKTGNLGGYIETSLPTKSDRRLSLYEQNIQAKARTFFNFKLPEITICGETLLVWASAPASCYRQKQRREKLYTLAINLLTKMGFKRTAIDYNGKPNDFRKWKLTFRTPETKKPNKRKAYIEIDTDAEGFINKFAEWSCWPIHYGQKKQRLSEAEIKERITRTIGQYGLESCNNIFNQVQQNSPHPREFWNKIKALKASLKNQTGSLKNKEVEDFKMGL